MRPERCESAVCRRRQVLPFTSSFGFLSLRPISPFTLTPPILSSGLLLSRKPLRSSSVLPATQIQQRSLLFRRYRGDHVYAAAWAYRCAISLDRGDPAIWFGAVDSRVEPASDPMVIDAGRSRETGTRKEAAFRARHLRAREARWVPLAPPRNRKGAATRNETLPVRRTSGPMV